MRSVRVTLPQAFRRQRPWGFSDPSVVMVDLTGHVSLESPVGSPYGVGDELSDGRFDCGMFSKMGSIHERVAYLHGCGYSVVPAGDGFAVRFEDDAPSVGSEDEVRTVVYEWETRRQRLPTESISGCPFKLCPDARVAYAIVEYEGDHPHMSLAAEYVASMDAVDGRNSYSPSEMSDAIDSVRAVSDADSHFMATAAMDVADASERILDENKGDFLAKLSEKMRRFVRVWHIPLLKPLDLLRTLERLSRSRIPNFSRRHASAPSAIADQLTEHVKDPIEKEWRSPNPSPGIRGLEEHYVRMDKQETCPGKRKNGHPREQHSSAGPQSIQGRQVFGCRLET